MKTNVSVDGWAFRASASLSAELDEFQQVVERFQAGAISAGEFRALRVPMGVYEQRENGAYMLRVRFPAGGVPPAALRRLGEVSREFGNGVLHVTTRQEFQVHRVPVTDIIPALRSLAAAGLSSKGGGGNTVRNITACVDAGVCRDEIFDVTPYAIAVTERLLADPVSLQLPRKYKLAFAGCGEDCCGATVQDLGFVARRQNGRAGFAVYVAGGMGGKSRIASLLHEFIPAGDVWVVAEAIKRVFDKNGDRKNKHLARLRFLVEKIGLSRFRELYEAELAALQSTHPAPLALRPLPQPAAPPASAPAKELSAEYHRWFDHNVASQKQDGFFLVQIPLTLGDLPADQAIALAGIVAAHGDNALWATQSQNVTLRWVTAGELPVLHGRLAELGLATPEALILQNLVSCAGAATCRLGICLSRGLAKAIRHELAATSLDLDTFGDFSLHISGCPNSCGRHPVAHLGFSGAARRVGTNLVPFYAVQVGGRLGQGRSRFGKNIGAVPAKHAPAFTRELLAAWKNSPEAKDFNQFIDGAGSRTAADLLARYQEVPPIAQRRDFYSDWDATAPFSLAGRGQGECSAGVFDLIEVDLANAREAQEAGRFYVAAVAAARALLVVQNARPKTDAETFVLFQRHFIAPGLVDAALLAVTDAGTRAAGTADPAKNFAGDPADVAALVATVRMLYEGLDSSLRFKAPARA